MLPKEDRSERDLSFISNGLTLMTVKPHPPHPPLRILGPLPFTSGSTDSPGQLATMNE